MSETIKSKLRVRYKYEQNVNVETKKLEVRQSTNEKAGLGVFACEFIPAGTIFLKSGTISQKINDLAYKGDCLNYDTTDNIEHNINVGYIVKEGEHGWLSSFEVNISQIYLYLFRKKVYQKVKP